MLMNRALRVADVRRYPMLYARRLPPALVDREAIDFIRRFELVSSVEQGERA